MGGDIREANIRIVLVKGHSQGYKTRSSDIVMECQNYFGFYTISALIRKKKATFLW